MKSQQKTGKADFFLKGALISVFLFVFVGLFSALSEAEGLQDPCPSDMTHYWKLDENSSPYVDFYDANNAICTDCPTETTGIINGAQQFAVTNMVNVADDNTFDWNATDSFSVEFWMKTDSASTCSGNQAIVGRDDGHIQWWVGCLDGGKAAFCLYDTSRNGACVGGNTKDLTDGKWHHVVAIRDASAGENLIYVDGTLEDSVVETYSYGFDSATAALNIGWLNLGSGYHFAGTIDEVALYNKALSDVEIRSHYYFVRGYCVMCATPVKIMPLGDSITHGTYGSGDTRPEELITGYRQPLYLSLENAGYYVDFVGSLHTGQSATPPFDYDHEGHGGYTSDQVLANINNWLSLNPPDVILLHIGTNDILAGTEDAQKIASILDQIDNYNKDITVVLARIINRNICSATTTQFNNNVQAMAEQRIANGDKIIIVDQESALTYPDDIYGELHPNDTGYSKMAEVWFDALRDFLPVCAEIAPTIFSRPISEASVGGVYRYDIEATGNPAPTYSLVAAPSGMTINASTGLIQWTPGTTGTYSVSVEALNSMGIATQNFTITVSEFNTVKIWLEAEGGVLYAPMAVASNAQASLGQYIWIPNGQGSISDASQPGGYAEYTFSVPNAGNYIVWGRVISNTDDDDSFFVSMDYGAYSLWDTQRGGTETWVWDLVNNRGGADPVVYSLGAGQHTLVIKQREDGTKIDKILITSDLQYIPQAFGE